MNERRPHFAGGAFLLALARIGNYYIPQRKDFGLVGKKGGKLDTKKGPLRKIHPAAGLVVVFSAETPASCQAVRETPWISIEFRPALRKSSGQSL